LSGSSKYIDTATLKRLSRLSPWRTALAVAGDWAVIALAVMVSEWSGNWLVYLACLPIIAGGMHGLGALMHEFSHHRFSANKQLNDVIGDLFTAWPLLATTSGYRRNHLAHHRYTNTDKDPDWVVKLGKRYFTFPQEMRFALLHVLGYFVGVNSIRDMRVALTRIQHDEVAPPAYKIAKLSYYLAIAVVLVAFGWWQEALLYWAVPYLTLFFLFLYIRVVAEHFGPTLAHDGEMTNTRTVIPLPVEAWFFAPHGLNYHLEHHLYPSVPFYRLGELHEVLMRNDEFAACAHVTHGYTTGLLREVLIDGRQKKPSSHTAMVPGE
jgi:fatty acid desaturase